MMFRGRNIQEPAIYTIDVSVANDNVGDQTTGMQFASTEAWYLHEFVTQIIVDAGAPAYDLDLLTAAGIAYRNLAADNPAVNDRVLLTPQIVSEAVTNVPNVVGAPVIPMLVPADHIIRCRIVNLDAAGSMRMWLTAECLTKALTKTVIGADETTTVNEGDTFA